MKTIRILSACFCIAIASQTSTAQTPAPPLSAATTPVAPASAATGTTPLTTPSGTVSLTTPATTVQPVSAGTGAATGKTEATVCAPICYPQEMQATGIILVYLPPVLLLLILIYLFRLVKKGVIKLSDLLAENNLPDNHPATATGAAKLQDEKMKSMQAMKQMGISPSLDGVTETTTEPVTPPQSTSRVVLLLAGLAAVVIAVVLCSYAIYSYQRFGNAPDWDKFTGILITLGIGVTPYTVKQVFK